MLLVPGLASGGAGCGRTSKGGDSTGKAPAIKLGKDTEFGPTGHVEVVQVNVSQAPVLDAPTLSPNEPASVSRARRKIQRAGRLRSHLLIHPKRLVWALPDQAVPGGAAEPLYLVLKPGAPVALLVNPKKHRYRAAPLARLAALMEGALAPTGVLHHVEILSRLSDEAGVEKIGALLVASGSRSRGTVDLIRYTLHTRTVAAPGSLAGVTNLVWDWLLLPLVPPKRTVPGLDALRGKGRWPTRFEWTPTRRERALASHLRLRWTLDLEHRETRRVETRLLQFPPAGYRQVFGPVTLKPGRRLLHRLTRNLRPRRPKEPRSGAVVARNRTTRSVFVYGDGMLLGWVAPRAEAQWPVLPAGYYRFYGHSLLGTVLWGPQDAYVPGPVVARTLDRSP